MYFMIKDEKCFDKYMKIWEKVGNITKHKFNSELICNQKYLMVKKMNTKESFQCFYIRVILIDSVYRKDKNYYPKVFLEKYIYNFLKKNLRNFGFWCFRSSS